MSRTWVSSAIRRLERDFRRLADTHLFAVDVPGLADVRIYLNDESTHPTGSLKHRLARSLFLYGLCNGWIDETTPIIEASSGSTAVSEAYFARMLGLRFIAVMPEGTSPAKLRQIEFHGGQCHFTRAANALHAEAERLARECYGHFMDQFTFAERATDWRGNNNIGESIFQQMRDEPHPVPSWIVVSAGTGGTAAPIGRYLRFAGFDTRLCVVDPEHSVFFDYYRDRDPLVCSDHGSSVEGIGRPRVERSFIPEIVDRMIRVPDAASYAAMRFLERLQGRKYGGSTGTNFWGALQLACEMRGRGESGSIVTLACDAGDRYLDTYYSDEWLARNGYDIAPHLATLAQACATGGWHPARPCAADDVASA